MEWPPIFSEGRRLSSCLVTCWNKSRLMLSPPGSNSLELFFINYNSKKLRRTNQEMRKIAKILSPPIVPEGKGAQVIRVIGTQQLPSLNPFLMLDLATSKLPSGFPDHPHRGFETVSYLLQGSFYHEDSKGNHGRLLPGDVQWMTAGKGVVHAEMPGSFEELSIGFQLWINLQAKHKMCEPQYQEFRKDLIPEAKQKGVLVKVIAGEAYGVKGPIYTRTPAFYMDVQVEPDSQFDIDIPLKWNGLAFVYEGDAEFCGKAAKKHQSVLLDLKDSEQRLQVKTGKSVCKFMLMAGEPIDEPIVQHGPFVMNSEEEIRQTFRDYQEGKNGFEGVHQWQSKIRELSKRK